MALFAIVIALLLEQIRPLGAQSLAARQLRVWTRQTAANTDAGTALHGWLAWSLAVVLPAVLAAAIHLLALWAGGWLLALAWNVVVLYLTLGFRQFSHHFTAIRDVTFNGIDPFDETGVGVAGGDVNGDGYEDLTVGARQADPDGREDAGETYVVFGPFGAGMTVELAQADLLIKGKRRGDLSGYGVDTGDINHDGHLDLLVGAWAAEGSGVLNAGELYVLFGPRSAGTWDLNSDADITISGLGQEDHLGVGARSGDLNLDGYDDLMIGATTSDPDGRMEAGRAFIVYGPLDAGYYHVGDIANFYFNGIDPADYFGIGVANGDLTNDGIPDLIFGAFRADPHDKFNAGETYVVFGSLADVSLTMQANTPQPQTGMPLTYELIMANGGPGPAPNVAIVDRLSPDVTYAGSNVAECSYDPQAHAVTCLFPGLAANTAFSLYISVIPDTDGTITNTATIVSDVLDADLGNNAGIAMTIVAPACAGLTPTILGTEGADQLVGTAGNDVIFARGGDDTILGGDGDDVICGGTGNDQISGNAGSDQILGENGNDQLTGLDGDDTFWGGAGDDLIIGGPGNDSANCGSEDDYFDGGADYDYTDTTVAANILYFYWVEPVGDIWTKSAQGWVTLGRLTNDAQPKDYTPYVEAFRAQERF